MPDLSWPYSTGFGDYLYNLTLLKEQGIISIEMVNFRVSTEHVRANINLKVSTQTIRNHLLA